MSARAGSWELLGHAGDPLPGDDYEVAAQAQHYRSVADTISEQISRLRDLSNGDAQGHYVEGLTTTADDIAEDLSKVQNRFETVAEQLRVWEPELAEGRRVTGSLLRRAEEAHHAMSANQPSTTPLPSDATDAQREAEHQRGQRFADAQGELSSLVGQFNSELARVRSTARRVAGKIDDAAHDKVKDSWWDSHVRKWVHDHAHLIEIIVKVLEIVAIVVAVVALVVLTGGAGLAALIGVGAEVLATVATVAEVTGAVLSGALLASHALEMDAGVNGVGWGSIALDVLSLATFGAGRFLKVAGTGAEGLASTVRSEAAVRAEAGLASNIKNALRITRDANPLKVWAQGERTAAITSAVARVNRIIASPSSIGVKILAGDAELAQTVASLRAMENLPSVASSAERFLRLARLNVAVNVVDHLHLSHDAFEWFKGLGEHEGEGA